MINENGPIASGALLRQLEAKGVSPAAARKRIQRLGSSVRRLRGHGLPKNQQLLYVKEDWKSPRFIAALLSAWEAARSAHGNAVSVLGREGVPCPRYLFLARSGAPISLKSHVSAERILAQLQDLEVVTVQDMPDVGESVLLKEHSRATDVALPYVRARLLAERIVIDALGAWFPKLGLVSYQATKCRDPASMPEFARFSFDLVAPSYARPLASMVDGVLKPGFVVADVWLSHLSRRRVGGFVRKVGIARAQHRTRPFLSFLVADRFTKDAWRLGKQNGLLFTTPELLFGKDVHKALKELVSLLASAAKRLDSAPTKVASLFNSLARIEGAAANLRGPLFELLVAYIMSREEAGSIDIRRLVTDNAGNRAEIDVLVKGAARVRAIECRGHAPGRMVSTEEVAEWRESRIPRWRDWLDRDAERRHLEHSFEYWTTGTFLPDALSYLEAQANSVKKYKITWHDGDSVVGAVRRVKATGLVETLNEHYLKHPLAAQPG